MSSWNRPLLAALSALVACAQDPGAASRVGSEAEADTVCAPKTVLEGVDVSYYQTSADFGKVKASGRAFAITRVSDGLGTIDTKFDTYYPAIKAAGMVRGAYQYFEPKDDPIQQADLLLKKIGGALTPGDLPPTLDMERTGTGLTPAAITSKMKAWLDHVEAALGVKPIIYTGTPYWTSDLGNPAGYEAYPLWIAGYPCNFSDVAAGSYCPKIPDEWPKWTFWQYSDGSKQTCASDGVTPPSVSGIPGDGGDRDFFPGTLAELLALAGGGAGGSGAGGGTTTGTYAAKYVSQSWPLSDAPAIEMQVGQTMTGSIDLKNTGDVTWTAGVVDLAPIPRDMASDFQSSSWVSPTRVSTLAADVAPGDVGHFEWDLTPAKEGDFSPYFGLVADGITWFADSGGPPDNDIQVHVVVSAAPPGSGGSSGAGGMAGVGGAPVGGSGGSSGGAPMAGGHLDPGGSGGSGGSATGSAGAGGKVAAGGHASSQAGAGGANGEVVTVEGAPSGSSGGCEVGRGGDPRGLFALAGLVVLAARQRRRMPKKAGPATL